MRIVVFEAEPREAPLFETLRGLHELVFVDAPLRSDNAAHFAEPAR